MVHLFCFLGVFIFHKSRSPCRKKRIFEKRTKIKHQKKTQFLKLKSGPIMLRNIIGPLFNFNLAHFLTLEFCFFFCFFCFVLGWNPYFYSVFSKKCKTERNTKKKKRHYLWTQLCYQLLSKCPFFSAFLILLFFEFPCFFQRCFWQVSKNQK